MVLERDDDNDSDLERLLTTEFVRRSSKGFVWISSGNQHKTLGSRRYYDPHIRNEETEAQS